MCHNLCGTREPIAQNYQQFCVMMIARVIIIFLSKCQHIPLCHCELSQSTNSLHIFVTLFYSKLLGATCGAIFVVFREKLSSLIEVHQEIYAIFSVRYHFLCSKTVNCVKTVHKVAIHLFNCRISF